MLEVQHIDHVALTVSDVERSAEWYARVLGLERGSQWDGEPVMMCAGETCLALFSAEGKAAAMSDADKNSRLTMRHFAFRVDRANFERAQKVFREQKMSFRFADHGAAHSLYISDPDGHTIELTTYEV